MSRGYPPNGRRRGFGPSFIPPLRLIHSHRSPSVTSTFTSTFTTSFPSRCLRLRKGSARGESSSDQSVRLPDTGCSLRLDRDGCLDVSPRDPPLPDRKRYTPIQAGPEKRSGRQEDLGSCGSRDSTRRKTTTLRYHSPYPVPSVIPFGPKKNFLSLIDRRRGPNNHVVVFATRPDWVYSIVGRDWKQEQHDSLLRYLYPCNYLNSSVHSFREVFFVSVIGYGHT